MGNTPSLSRRVLGPDAAAASARLAAIQEHLDEILRRLDELRNLLAMLDRVEPNREHVADD